MADEEPRKEYMTYCGEYEMRSGGPEHGKDGINGTIVAPQSKIKAAGAGAGEEVRVLVEANGKSATLTRKIHNSGNTLTIPLDDRKSLDLEPGDNIEFWIEEVEDEEEEVQQTASSTEEMQKTLEEEVEGAEPGEYIAIIGNSLTYHLLEGEEDEETVCGVSLEEEDYRVGEDPGDVLDACHDCKAHSSKPMTNEEIVDWLGKEVGFKKTDGPPAYFNKKQLVALKDAFVKMQDELREAKAKRKEYQARNARLQQEIQNLEERVEKLEQRD